MYHDEEDYDSMHYDIDITFNVRIAKWRIDDPRVKENREWSLAVYDRNLEEWVNINELDRPGEYGMISGFKITAGGPLRVPKLDRGADFEPVSD